MLSSPLCSFGVWGVVWVLPRPKSWSEQKISKKAIKSPDYLRNQDFLCCVDKKCRLVTVAPQQFAQYSVVLIHLILVVKVDGVGEADHLAVGDV